MGRKAPTERYCTAWYLNYFTYSISLSPSWIPRGDLLSDIALVFLALMCSQKQFSFLHEFVHEFLKLLLASFR